MRRRISARTRALLIAIVLIAFASWQPWSYNYHGFAEGRVDIAGGRIDFELLDQAGKKRTGGFCLFSTFRTDDEPGEPVTLHVDAIGTRTQATIATSTESTGATADQRSTRFPRSYFEATGIPKIFLPPHEPLIVSGWVRYKGKTYPFNTALELRHWEKSRKVIRFCV